MMIDTTNVRKRRSDNLQNITKLDTHRLWINTDIQYKTEEKIDGNYEAGKQTTGSDSEFCRRDEECFFGQVCADAESTPVIYGTCEFEWWFILLIAIAILAIVSTVTCCIGCCICKCFKKIICCC